MAGLVICMNCFPWMELMMQGLEYCGGNGIWTNKEVHSPTSPPSHLSLISPPPPPPPTSSYPVTFPVWVERENVNLVLRSSVFTHICRLLSLFAPTMCVISVIEWTLTVNDVASLTSRCFPLSQVRPKCPGALCIITLSDPPQQAFIPLKSFPASHHTQEGTLSNHLETEMEYICSSI